MKLTIKTNRAENILGYIYLAVYQLLLPSIISLVAQILGFRLTLSGLNIAFFITNFVWVVAIFHRFLGKSLQVAGKKIWRCLGITGLSLVLYFLAMLFVSLLIVLLYPTFSNVNDDSIAGLAEENTEILFICTVFLAPVVEETMYRGLIFRPLQSKSRLLAYAVSVAVFGLIHIVGYVGSADWITLLLCFVQYLPAGITLAWAYEKTDTIITPMLIHIAINLIGMSALLR